MLDYPEMAVSHLGYLFEQTELSDATAAIKWLEDQVIVENNLTNVAI